MIEWSETREILGRIRELGAEGRSAALATVVRIDGSAYRRAGARFLVEEEGDTLGGVSGGCLEADVRSVAAEIMGGAPPRLLHYDTGQGDGPWGLGLGCEGAVDVFVQPAAPHLTGGVTERLQTLLDGDEPFVTAVLVSGSDDLGRTVVLGADDSPAADDELAARAHERLRAGNPGLDTVGDALAFFQVFTPPPRLLVFGAGDDAIPLVRYAADAGFRVTVVDHRPAFLEGDRFPAAERLATRRPEEGLEGLGVNDATYAVIMTHSLAGDRGWLTALAATPAAYIGLLGPRQRTSDLLEEVPETARSRIYGPVGLDLGADGAAQVALSILAEVMAVHAGRTADPLRERSEAIHAS